MAKNTLFMYFRMAIIIAVQLYTVPVVLHSLGIEDYGIYNVVAGFVAMFTFVNSSLISGCQRFMAFAIGTKNTQDIKNVFNSSLFVFVLMALVLLVILEVVGVWILNTQMTIPPEKMFAANWVLQLSIASLLITVVATPFNSAIVAHEAMSIYAYASVFESVYKLFIAISLSIILSGRLIYYAALMLSASVIMITFYVVYCRRHFQEAKHISLTWNPALLKEMGIYAGWNIIGSIAIILRNHGLNVVMNLFFSPIMNATHTIAANISGLLNNFVNNIYIATRPQMVKQFASGNINEMWNITFKSSKYAFFLMVFIVIPLLIELPTFLDLWLSEYPTYTVAFARLMVFSLLLETITNQIIGVFQAANKIKYYQTVSSLILLSLLPLSYIALLINKNPILPYFLYVLVSFVYILSLIVVSYRQLHLDFLLFFREVILKDLTVFLIPMLLTCIAASYIPIGIFRLFVVLLLSTVTITIVVWFYGMSKSEKKMIIKYIKSKRQII